MCVDKLIGNTFELNSIMHQSMRHLNQLYLIKLFMLINETKLLVFMSNELRNAQNVFSSIGCGLRKINLRRKTRISNYVLVCVRGSFPFSSDYFVVHSMLPLYMHRDHFFFYTCVCVCVCVLLLSLLLFP